MECDHCNKLFSNKYTLATHKAKLTGEQQYTCEFCNKSLSSKERLTKHMALCRSNVERDTIRNTRMLEYEAKIESLQRQLADKTAQLDEILDERKTRKFLQLDLNPEAIREKFLEISTEDLKKGQEGIARFLVSNILTNSSGEILYKCVDQHRQKFIYYNTYGKRCVDYGAENLIYNLKIFDDLTESSKKLCNMDDTDLFLEWASLIIDLTNIKKRKFNQDFRRNLTILLS